MLRLSPYYDTDRVPNYYGLQLSRMAKPPNGTGTIRLLQRRGDVRLLFTVLVVFPTPHRFFPRLSLPGHLCPRQLT